MCNPKPDRLRPCVRPPNRATRFRPRVPRPRVCLASVWCVPPRTHLPDRKATHDKRQGDSTSAKQRVVVDESFSAYRTRLPPQLQETRSVKGMTVHQQTEAVSTAHYSFQTHRTLHHFFQRRGHLPELLGDERASDLRGGVVARGRSW